MLLSQHVIKLRDQSSTETTFCNVFCNVFLGWKMKAVALNYLIEPG